MKTLAVLAVLFAAALLLLPAPPAKAAATWRTPPFDGYCTGSIGSGCYTQSGYAWYGGHFYESVWNEGIQGAVWADAYGCVVYVVTAAQVQTQNGTMIASVILRDPYTDADLAGSWGRWDFEGNFIEGQWGVDDPYNVCYDKDAGQN
jgi:hypothetical protein